MLLGGVDHLLVFVVQADNGVKIFKPQLLRVMLQSPFMKENSSEVLNSYVMWMCAGHQHIL
jgi:hypothetical protein